MILCLAKAGTCIRIDLTASRCSPQRSGWSTYAVDLSTKIYSDVIIRLCVTRLNNH